MSSRKEQKEQAKLDREAKERAAAASTQRKRRLGVIGGVLGIAAIAVIVAVLVSSGALESSDIKGGTEVEERFAGIPQRGVELGEKNAPATIVEFADLKCPFCAEFAENGLPQLIEEYVKTGKAKVVFRNLTILDDAAPGNDSTDAATMAAAAGIQNKLWNYVDLFYLNQKDENTVFATDSFLESIGAEIPGLDVQKAMDDRSSNAVKAQLTAATAAAELQGVTGTPTFYVGPTGGKLTQVTLDDLSDVTAIGTAVEALQK